MTRWQTIQRVRLTRLVMTLHKSNFVIEATILREEHLP
jgi:hypothetical protein